MKKCLLLFMMVFITTTNAQNDDATITNSTDMNKAIELSNKYKTLLTAYGITTPLRLQMFFAQAWHESRLELKRENLNYSAQGLADTWPNRFAQNATAKVKTPNALALKLHRNPIAIANSVYASRMGNGNEATGDGYKYRGGGFFQHTGYEEYLSLQVNMKVPFLDNPDLINEEANAMVGACLYWNKKGMNRFADAQDVEGATRKLNGGVIGLKEREKAYVEFKKIFR